MKTVVFSDVHLQPDQPPAEGRVFTGFLYGLCAGGVERVVILGDLFDFWFEYRHAIFSGYFEVLRALAALRDGGVEVHLVCGNHDFWSGRFLEETLGMRVYREPARMDFGGRQALLVHGDGENPRDRAYRVYKRIARAKPVIGLFRLLHPDFAMGLARCVSGTSRRLARVEDPAKGAEAAALREFAAKTLAAGPFDIVMAGHAHAPAIEEIATARGRGLYINTGDWLYHRSYVEWDGEDFRLLYSARQDDDAR